MAMTQPESIVKANSVISVKVKSTERENLGKIEEIMIDKLSGEVQYVVLSFGGILGMGEKLFALPWRSISYSPEDESFILNIDKETLKNAPGFARNNWPDMADPLWKKTIESYYPQFEAVKNKAKETLQDIADDTKDTLAKCAEEVKKSGKDWLSYILNHPAQSVLFGIMGYFTLKGITKN